MRNAYYHAFTIGFNWWMVLIPVSMLVLAYFGWNNPYYSRRKGKIVRHFNDRFYAIVSTICTVIFTVLLFVESGDGILQFFDNGLMWNDSPFWSLLESALAIPSIGFLYGFILLCVGQFAEKLKKNQIKQLRSIRKNEIASSR